MITIKKNDKKNRTYHIHHIYHRIENPNDSKKKKKKKYTFEILKKPKNLISDILTSV